MTSALTERMEDARKVGVKAQKAYDKKKGDEEVEAPAATTSVEGAAQKMRGAAHDLDSSYLAFQEAVTLDQEAAAIKESGAEAQKRLDEINEIKTFLKNVGKTADFAQGLVRGPEQIANWWRSRPACPGVPRRRPSSSPTSSTGRKSMFHHDARHAKGMIEKKKLVKEFAKVVVSDEGIPSALMKFAEVPWPVPRHERKRTPATRHQAGQVVPGRSGVAQRACTGREGIGTRPAWLWWSSCGASPWRASSGLQPRWKGACRRRRWRPRGRRAAGVIEHRDTSYHPNPTPSQGGREAGLEDARATRPVRLRSKETITRFDRWTKVMSLWLPRGMKGKADTAFPALRR
jgi:hypothetical protein